MEPEDVEVLELELKYCERCGGLWLRVRGLEDVYCSSCSAAMSEVAVGRRSRRSPRLPIFHTLDGQCEIMTALGVKEGHA
jgi:Transcription factor zinc-finger